MKSLPFIYCSFFAFGLVIALPVQAGIAHCPFVFSFQDDGQVKADQLQVVRPGEELIELSRSDDFFKYNVYLLKPERPLPVDPDDIDSAAAPFKHALNYPIDGLARALSTFESKPGDFWKKAGALACYGLACAGMLHAGMDFFSEQLHVWRDLLLGPVSYGAGRVASNYIKAKEKVDIVAAVQAHAKFMWKTFLKRAEEKEAVLTSFSDTEFEYITFEGDPTLTIFIVVNGDVDAHQRSLEDIGFKFKRRIARD